MSELDTESINLLFTLSSFSIGDCHIAFYNLLLPRSRKNTDFLDSYRYNRCLKNCLDSIVSIPIKNWQRREYIGQDCYDMIAFTMHIYSFLLSGMRPLLHYLHLFFLPKKAEIGKKRLWICIKIQVLNKIKGSVFFSLSSHPHINDI